MTKVDTIEAACRDLLASGADIQAVVRLLRDGGSDKIASIKVLNAVAGMDLGKAKEVVHLSPVWADRRKRDDAFHDLLFKAAQRVADEQKS